MLVACNSAHPCGIWDGLLRICEIWGSTAVAVKINVCWEVTSFNQVEICSCFGGTYCLRLHSQWFSGSRAYSSEAYLLSVLQFCHRRFVTTPVLNVTIDQAVFMCWDAYPFAQGWQLSLLGNINLDTPKPINTEMKTSVGIAWRIVVFSAQDALVSEDLRKLRTQVSDMGKCIPWKGTTAYANLKQIFCVWWIDSLFKQRFIRNLPWVYYGFPDDSGCAVWGMNRLRPLEHWDRGFESY
jgi:hypothetical protein